MKKHVYFLIFCVLISCNSRQPQAKILSGKEIIAKSIKVHDPNQKWSGIKISIHIQEPRISDPFRYSTVKLNIENGEFELQRNRDDHISTHVVDSTGNAKVLLDGQEKITDSLVKKYKLSAERNKGYRNFYNMMYGLPMALENSITKYLGNTKEVVFNEQECYKISVELKEPLFSKYWHIFVSKKTFECKGVEITFPDDASKGERLYFEGEFFINGIKIPRIRHWYEYSDDQYSGSDIIVKEL